MSWEVKNPKFKVGMKVKVNVCEANFHRLANSENINMRFLEEIRRLDNKIVEIKEINLDSGVVHLWGERYGTKNWGISSAHHFILEPPIQDFVPEDLFTL